MATRLRPTIGQRTSLVAGSLVLSLTLFAWAMPPLYNWDMLPYVSLALGEGDPARRHVRLWQLVEQEVPAVELSELKGEIARFPADPRTADLLSYRRVTAQDAHSFAEQLPFYAVKPMYPMAIAGVAALPLVNPVEAAVVIARLAWVGLGVVLFLLLRMRFSNPLAALLTVLGMGVPTVRVMSSFASPDGLSALLILLGFLFALRNPVRSWTLAACGMVLLAIAARPDNLLLLGLFLLWFLGTRRLRFGATLAIGGVGLAWYLAVASLSGNYGWLVLMHHSFIDFLEYPSQLVPQFDAALLAGLYLSKVGSSVTFFKFIGLGATMALARLWLRGRRDALLQAQAVMLLFMLAHWLLFPDQKDRLMVASYLFILASSAFVLADYLGHLRHYLQNTPNPRTKLRNRGARDGAAVSQ